MSSAFKLVLAVLSPEMLLFWSVLFALLILSIVLIIQGKLSETFKQNRNEWRNSALLGLLNPFAYYLVLSKAYQLLRAQEAGILNYSWPVVLVILSVPLLGQKIGVKGFAAIFLSFFGLILIATQGKPLNLEFTHPLGVALAISSAFFWALYWIFNLKDNRDSLVKITSNMIFGLSYVVLYIFLFNKWEFNGIQTIAGAVYIGIFEMGITFVWWLTALKHAESTAKVSNLVFLSPFLALFWIRIFVGEKILASTLIGLLFIVGGILLQQGVLSCRPFIRIFQNIKSNKNAS